MYVTFKSVSKSAIKYLLSEYLPTFTPVEQTGPQPPGY